MNLLHSVCKYAHNKSPSANIRCYASTAAVLRCHFRGFITFTKVWLGAISSNVVNVTRSGSGSLCESGHACASLSCFCRRKWCVASRAAYSRTAAHQMTLEADWQMSGYRWLQKTAVKKLEKGQRFVKYTVGPFIQQICNKLIKSDSKDIMLHKISISNQGCYLIFPFMKESVLFPQKY